MSPKRSNETTTPGETTSDDEPAAEILKGSVKEAIGKLIGDGKVEAEGKAERTDPAAQTSAKSDAKPEIRPKPSSGKP